MAVPSPVILGQADRYLLISRSILLPAAQVGELTNFLIEKSENRTPDPEHRGDCILRYNSIDMISHVLFQDVSDISTTRFQNCLRSRPVFTISRGCYLSPSPAHRDLRVRP
jgi:hypothetical protein